MKVAIRTDASSVIGSGHLMRCLTLAAELKKLGAKVKFICFGQERKWIEYVRNREFDCEVLYLSNRFGTTHYQRDFSAPSSYERGFQFNWQQDLVATRNILKTSKFDWLIVDHYGIDWRWEKALRPYTRHIMVIDDLADRKHECDIVLDCVFGRQAEDYLSLVPDGCRLLLGTKYALLRSEFADWRSIALNRRMTSQTVRNILVSLGGVDQTNLTGKVLDQLKRVDWNSDCRIDVIADVNDMAKRISNSDLGIGAFGVSTWERFCLGLPSINIVTEENQHQAISALKQQTCSGIMFVHSIGSELVQFVNQLVSNPKIYLEFALWCSQSVDGKGLTRVVKQIEEIY